MFDVAFKEDADVLHNKHLDEVVNKIINTHQMRPRQS